MHKIKKGDDVIVRSGKDKGKRGKVLQVIDGGVKLLIEGINIVKKHVKPNPQRQIKGAIAPREMPLQSCKVGLYNPLTKRADRVGIRVLENGQKVRYFKSNDELVDITES